MPSSKAFPVAAAGPVLGPTTPILIVSAAQTHDPIANIVININKRTKRFISIPPSKD
jgi:hypothetical protein